MKIGLITDTHDKYDLIQKAVKVFEREGCGVVLHGGDFCSDKAYQILEEGAFDFQYVTDHNSHDRKMKHSRKCLKAKIGECRFAMYHNTYDSADKEKMGMVQDLGASGKYDFVVYGHLHYFNLKLPGSENETVILNSGGFYYKELSTFCVLDLESAQLTLFYLLERHFEAILRFPIFGVFEDIKVLDFNSARVFADHLREMRWKFKDCWEYVFSADTDRWLSKNYDILFKKLKIKDNPEFFY